MQDDADGAARGTRPRRSRRSRRPQTDPTLRSRALAVHLIALVVVAACIVVAPWAEMTIDGKTRLSTGTSGSNRAGWVALALAAGALLHGGFVLLRSRPSSSGLPPEAGAREGGFRGGPPSAWPGLVLSGGAAGAIGYKRWDGIESVRVISGAAGLVRGGATASVEWGGWVGLVGAVVALTALAAAALASRSR